MKLIIVFLCALIPVSGSAGEIVSEHEAKTLKVSQSYTEQAIADCIESRFFSFQYGAHCFGKALGDEWQPLSAVTWGNAQELISGECKVSFNLAATGAYRISVVKDGEALNEDEFKACANSAVGSLEAIQTTGLFYRR